MSRSTGRADRPKRLRIGDRVLLRWPGSVMEAEVIADRGSILPDDGQVVRIRATEPTDLPSEFDVPAEWIEPVPEGRAA